MRLLIDGYNLLHVTGLFGGGAGSFEQSRAALLSFIALVLDDEECRQTTIVFDAAEAPPGLPHLYQQHGLTVHFARDHASADDLLEELIEAHHSPKRLLVVSSDRRVQRAATKRRATAIESHAWYSEKQLQLDQRRRGRKKSEHKPEAPLSAGEVQNWLRLFGPISIADLHPTDVVDEPLPAPIPRPAKRKSPKAPGKSTNSRPAAEASPEPAKAPRKKAVPRQPRKHRGKPPDLGFGSIENPFPPGYGEDLLES